MRVVEVLAAIAMLAPYPLRSLNSQEARVSANSGALPVPFVGCRSDGQTGSKDAPEVTSTVALPARAARALAYYKAAVGTGILAPRGWYCLGFFGSGGEGLILSPEPIDNSSSFATGPAIEVNH